MKTKFAVWALLAILIIAGLSYYFLSGTSITPLTPSRLVTFQGTHRGWFEGFDEIKYEFSYPGNRFEIASNDPTSHLVFREKATGVTTEIKITVENGRGFSPRDYWEQILKVECPNCTETTGKVEVAEAESTLTFENASNQWIIFNPKSPNTGWLFIAKLAKPADEALQIVESFHVSGSSYQQPASEFNVFFSSSKLPSDTCTEVEAVFRLVPKTSAIATAAITELLRGPSEYEKTTGLTSAIPAGSKLNSIRIESGVAYVDFNSVAESGGGSCSMTMRTTQIKKTLLQFPSVKSVRLSIDGRTEDIFQP